MIPTAEEFIQMNQPDPKNPFRLGKVVSVTNVNCQYDKLSKLLNSV